MKNSPEGLNDPYGESVFVRKVSLRGACDAPYRNNKIFKRINNIGSERGIRLLFIPDLLFKMCDTVCTILHRICIHDRIQSLFMIHNDLLFLNSDDPLFFEFR